MAFRSSASSILNERGYDADVIEWRWRTRTRMRFEARIIGRSIGPTE